MLILKVILVLSFSLVFLQDIKDRQVYWFLFPTIGFLCGLLFYQNTLPELFYISAILNMTFISMLIFVMFLYIKLKIKDQVF